MVPSYSISYPSPSYRYPVTQSGISKSSTFKVKVIDSSLALYTASPSIFTSYKFEAFLRHSIYKL